MRKLEGVGRGLLEPGAKVRLTPELYGGDPRGDLGLDHRDVEIPGERGPLPAWYVPGERDTWVITVHGLGTTRAHPMNVMPFLHGQSLPVLDLAYRGDPGAPRAADGVGRFGASEWRDVDAAIRFALRYGARNVIVHGWSTGATMALYAAVESPSATGSAASSSTPRCWTGRPPCAPWPPPGASRPPCCRSPSARPRAGPV